MKPYLLGGSLLAVTLWWGTLPARGQSSGPSNANSLGSPAAEPLLPTSREGELIPQEVLDRNRVGGWDAPASGQPLPASPVSPDSPVPPPPHFFQQFKLDYTYLPGLGNKSLEINDVELSTTLAVPFCDSWAPVLITPGFGAHFWQGPEAGLIPPPPDLPPNLYDAYVEIGWRPRLARWLFADVAVTPGVYSDWNDVSSESFQMRGRGLAIVAFSPQCQVVLGALYINRNKTRILPAGGLIWNPDDDTKLQFVFPQPKLAHRFMTMGNTQWWGYVSGEFGGGRWSVERADGAIDSIDYTDIRAILGVEWIVPEGLKGHAEVGYVFARRVNFSSDTPDYKPDATVMLRAGISF